MEQGAARLHWAPRVPQFKIRRLYESDALGAWDSELIDEVAYGFYARCQSILTVTAAEHGRVACPGCGQVIERHAGHDETLRCERCGWQITWREYLHSYQHKQLSGGSAVGAFEAFVQGLPAAETPKDKMLLIDRLIHQVHKTALSGEETPFWRPAAVNLIVGNMTQVIALLEQLACGPASSTEVRQMKGDWRERVLPRLWSREGRTR